jgi:hypothetical protein
VGAATQEHAEKLNSAVAELRLLNGHETECHTDYRLRTSGCLANKKWGRSHRGAIAVAIVSLVSGVAIHAATKPVTAELKDARGQSVGIATLSEDNGGSGVMIELNVKNLRPVSVPPTFTRSPSVRARHSPRLVRISIRSRIIPDMFPVVDGLGGNRRLQLHRFRRGEERREGRAVVGSAMARVGAAEGAV